MQLQTSIASERRKSPYGQQVCCFVLLSPVRLTCMLVGVCWECWPTDNLLGLTPRGEHHVHEVRCSTAREPWISRHLPTFLSGSSVLAWLALSIH